ncbi:MAG: DUF427 domain-containing protein [Thermoleophilia bacterium]|nr:DUF427 domain-containing protein [Thermoleophilia bacterium]
MPATRVEPTPRWVRVRAGGEWIADSREALLVAWYGPGRLPTYAFPAAAVRTDMLSPSPGGGDGSVVPHDIRTGEVLEGAARLLVDPAPELADARGHWTFTWDGSVSWFEEATEVHVHARDTAKRVDVVPSERHVRVMLDGALLAESRRPHALFEAPLPTRWYMPMADVLPGVLEPSPTVSRCPYKGIASWFSVRAGGALHPDLAWTYPDPVPECPGVAGLVAFYNEHVDLVIDGVPQERPRTPWSSGGPEISPS